jgi:hypothetical protein
MRNISNHAQKDLKTDISSMSPSTTEIKDAQQRIEEIAKKSGDTPAKIYANLQKSERLEALEREITERKVFEFLKEQSEITQA